MMMHRKSNHKELVRGCTNYAKNSCMFQGQSCWFLHEEEEVMDAADLTNEDEANNSEVESDSPSVFQRVFRNMKPPLGKERTKQKAA